MTFSLSFNGNLASILTPLARLESGAALQAGCYAVNHTVAKAKTQVKKALAPQSGLKQSDIDKEIRQISASPGRPEASLLASGAYHRLSEFSARSTDSGVSAAPWNVRRIFPHTFIIRPYGGGVFKRKGNSRFPVSQLWGPAIPKEMVKDQALAAWERTLAAELPARVAHEWGRLMGGG